MLLPALFNTTVFALLGALHLFWVVRGQATAAALPTHTDGRLLFRPGPLPTLVVAAGLLGFACLSAAGLGWPVLPTGYVRTGNGLIAGLLALRAVGDFRFVGLTKRVKGTAFARNDTRYYTPLCLLLAFAALWLALFAA